MVVGVIGVLSGKCSDIRVCSVSVMFCVWSWLFGRFTSPMQILFCCWCIILFNFDMVEVFDVFEVNSLHDLDLALLTAYLCSLLRRLYSAQLWPPFV